MALRVVPADIRGAIAFPISPSLEGADSWRARDTLDVAALHDNVRRLVEAGVGGIASQGTTGEGMNLTLDEFHTLVETVVDAVGGRVPYFAGVTQLNTRDAIERARFAVQARADGVLSGLPMWQALSQANAVQFYQDLADANPDVPVMIYENPYCFRVTFASASWKALSNIPNVVAAKTTGDPGRLIGSLHAVGDRMTLMPIDNIYPLCYDIGARACWTTDVFLGPWAVLAMVRACDRGEMDLARDIMTGLHLTHEEYGVSIGDIMEYSSGWHKLNADAAGWTRGGPSRPPMVHIPDHLRQKASMFGRAYRAIADHYRPDAERLRRVTAAAAV